MSFTKTVKYEKVYLSDHGTFDEALDNLENFIESVYYEKRLHSGIVYLTPIEFEGALILNSVT
ncbi:MAG: hypothetical protein JRE64_16645 [Deltaproteobacteria bacterium]|nr:hypothetical protein [Deltaproteobacteria bacterium]